MPEKKAKELEQVKVVGKAPRRSVVVPKMDPLYDQERYEALVEHWEFSDKRIEIAVVSSLSVLESIRVRLEELWERRKREQIGSEIPSNIGPEDIIRWDQSVEHFERLYRVMKKFNKKFGERVSLMEYLESLP